KLFRYRHSKVIWHFHGVAPLTPKQRAKDAVKVQIFARRFGDSFLSVADGPYRNALDRGFPPDRVPIHYNGVDLARFSADEKRREDARMRLKASADQCVFLLLGYSPLVKGV